MDEKCLNDAYLDVFEVILKAYVICDGCCTLIKINITKLLNYIIKDQFRSKS